jgi:hypothetical protein
VWFRNQIVAQPRALRHCLSNCRNTYHAADEHDGEEHD